MSDLAEVLNWRSPELSACLTRGLGTFGVPEPMTLDEWAGKHFYLSKESSYVEQAWEAWPFQRAIMACISNNDIREVDFMKSARVGYTKMLLAAIAYFIEHKRRNQALWQPTDGDSDEFVKTELETMLRDWPGTLLVAAHDEAFLQGIGITGRLHADAGGWRRLPP